MTSTRHYDDPLQLPPVRWMDPPDRCLDTVEKNGARIDLRYGTIAQGPGTGILVVEIDNGPLQITLLPTRGMSIWQIICDGVPFKWNSPITGPVHPSLVPVFDPGGLGWLEGFDEFLVRCGLVSNGAPDFDEATAWRYPLHGRIANLPAQRIWCEPEEDGITVAGNVREQRLFFNNLELRARLRIRLGSRELELIDQVTNLGDAPATTQMLYHINVGRPLLDQGARLVAPVQEMAPRDARAAEDIAAWDVYEQATAGYTEAVHFFQLASDDAGLSRVMLKSKDAGAGLGLSVDTAALPYFVLWKNTASDRDGYVTGLEPATNFPNTRSFEESQGRVVKLAPGEHVTYRLGLCPLVGTDAVNAFERQVAELADRVTPEFHREPRNGWST